MRKIKVLLIMVIMLFTVSLNTEAKSKYDDYFDNCIAIGQTSKFELPYGLKAKKWRISNKKKAVIKKQKKGYCKIKGKKQGTVVLYVTVGNKTYKKKIKVFRPQINKTSTELFVGDETYLDLYGKDDTLYNSSLPIKWKSTNNNVVTVDEYGSCKAVGIGECDIIATLYKKKYKCHIVSKKTYVTKEALENTAYEKIDTTNGYIIKMTNNYIYPSSYEILYTFTKNGQPTYCDTTYNHVDSGQTSYYYIPNRDSEHDKDIDYDDISISFEVSYEEDYTLVAKEISLEKQYGNEEVMATFTNPRSKKICVYLVFVFYKNGKIINAYEDSCYVGKNNKGICKASYPYIYDDNYDIKYIDFDDFDVFIQEAYIDD